MSGPSLDGFASETESKLAEARGAAFRQLIWGDGRIDDQLSGIFAREYGLDIDLILLQFFLDPHPIELKSLHKLNGYRKREKSLGLVIVFNSSNLSRHRQEENINHVQALILDGLADVNSLFSEKLDTRFDLLIREVKRAFSCADHADRPL